MSLHEKIPGRFVIRTPGSKAFSPFVARDLEQFTAAIEAALQRPFDRFDPEKGEVFVDNQVVLNVEFVGTLGSQSIAPAEKPLPRHRIEKQPLKRAGFLKPVKAKQLGKSPRDRARLRRVRKPKP